MNRSTDSEAFPSLLEKLLAGEVICGYSNAQLHQYLQDQSHREDVDAFLHRIGRVLRTTGDGSGYFAAYRNINEPEVRSVIRRQFSQAMNDFEPLVRWLRVALSASKKSGAPLQPGDTLRGSELLEAIENAPALVEELGRLSRTRLFKNLGAGPKRQLDAILKRLCDEGYLVPKGPSGSVYVATGKWARLYEVLEFIVAHEHLDGDEDAPVQKELLH